MKKMITYCDICGEIAEKAYVMEIRPVLQQNQAGTVESWDICEKCRGTLKEFINGEEPRKSDVPIINTVSSVTAPPTSPGYGPITTSTPVQTWGPQTF